MSCINKDVLIFISYLYPFSRVLDSNAVGYAFGQQVSIWNLQLFVPLVDLFGNTLEFRLKASHCFECSGIGKQVFGVVTQEFLESNKHQGKSYVLLTAIFKIHESSTFFVRSQISILLPHLPSLSFLTNMSMFTLMKSYFVL